MKAIFILRDNKIIERFDSEKELGDYLHKINRHLNKNEEAYFSYNFLYENPDYFIEYCTNKQLLEEIDGRLNDTFSIKINNKD